MSTKIETLEKKLEEAEATLSGKTEAATKAAEAETKALNEAAAIRAELGELRTLAQQEKGLGTVEVARNGFPDGKPSDA